MKVKFCDEKEDLCFDTRMINSHFIFDKKQNPTETWLPAILFTLMNTWLHASLLIKGHKCLWSYGGTMYETFRYLLIIWDQNSNRKPETRISENCRIYVENGWVAEVETQDRMLLRWIRIWAVVNRWNICFQNTHMNQVIYSQLVLATDWVV